MNLNKYNKLMLKYSRTVPQFTLHCYLFWNILSCSLLNTSMVFVGKIMISLINSEINQMVYRY